MTISDRLRRGVGAALLPTICVMGLAFDCTNQALAAESCGQLLDKVRRSIVFVKAVRKNDDGSPAVPVTGTGFIVTKSGIIITAGHLIPDDLQKTEVFASIGSYGQHPFPLTFIRKYSDTDIALLQLPEVSHGNALQIKELDKQGRLKANPCVFGFPFDGELTFAEGKVTNDKLEFGRWQMSAPINPGYSGGPVMLNTGEVVGMAWGGKAFAQAMTFMVPGSQLKQALAGYDTTGEEDSAAGEGDVNKPARIRISPPTIRGSDNIYPVNLIISAKPSRPSLWVVAEDAGGDVWAQRQVSPTQPRFTLTISKKSSFPLSVYVIAVDKDASKAIKRLATDKAITLDDYDHEIVSNIEVIEQ